MFVVCPECGTKNTIPDVLETTKRYRCGKCNTVFTNLPGIDNKGSRYDVSDNILPISLATFLILGPLPKLMEKDILGKMYITFGRVLTLSCWLFEIGAVLGRFWIERVPIVVRMFEVESKQKYFTQYWSEQARNRLQLYGKQPNDFPTFVFETYMETFTHKKFEELELKELIKIGNSKLYHEQAQHRLRLAETFLIEGIMFGSKFSDLTHAMLVNQYEKVDIDSWEKARRYGVTLFEKPPQTSVAAREKEAIALARDYVSKYHPQLLSDLGLAESA